MSDITYVPRLTARENAHVFAKQKPTGERKKYV